MKINRIYKSIIFVLFYFFVNQSAFGQISVDAGLTPPKDRWIFRLQTRVMQKSMTDALINREMKTNSLNSVLAYGFRSNITFIIKTIFLFKNMEIGNQKIEINGLGPLMLLTKYGFYRYNDKETTLGIAGSVELALPTGSGGVTSDNWDIETGLLLSIRHFKNSFHINAFYRINDVSSEQSKVITGNEFKANFSYTIQFPLGSSSELSLAPVLEINYLNKYADFHQNDISLNNNESVLFISPGIKFTKSSFIIESLYKIPVYEVSGSATMLWDTNALIGIRYLF